MTCCTQVYQMPLLHPPMQHYIYLMLPNLNHLIIYYTYQSTTYIHTNKKIANKNTTISSHLAKHNIPSLLNITGKSRWILLRITELTWSLWPLSSNQRSCNYFWSSNFTSSLRKRYLSNNSLNNNASYSLQKGLKGL